ncbi:MAG TPA: HNH endonuclease signature motif containing protein, partial [Blastocatellia bacterium]|nr:HNH endonuclease signature motif containing protein [Blastocatellia bacterium]
ESRVRLTPPARFGGGHTHTPRRCDGAYPTERRLEIQMVQKLKGYRKLIDLWYEQNGKCPVCNQKITKSTGWNSHRIIWRSHGGSDGISNLVLLHPVCHWQVHSLGLTVAKPRPKNGVGKA